MSYIGSQGQALPARARAGHHLDCMTLLGLMRIFVRYHAILTYLAVGAGALAVLAGYPVPWPRATTVVVVILVLHPLAWYVQHRFILHSQWAYKLRPLAATWKRLHYDHHQNPTRFEGMMGPLRITLPAVAFSCIAVGATIGGDWYWQGGAALALATGMAALCYHEWTHCLMHLAFKPPWGWLQRMKQRHNEHHYFDEAGNFGVATYLWDRVMDSYYEKGERPLRSPTVFNLGYTREEAERYPHVRDLARKMTKSQRPGAH